MSNIYPIAASVAAGMLAIATVAVLRRRKVRARR